MLDDKYRIERLLAVGGMGAVYVGTHIKLRKRVAIKVITHSGGIVKICIDDLKLAEFAVPAMKLSSTFTPHFGRNVRWSPQGAFFDGSIDDVRAFKTALACE